MNKVYLIEALVAVPVLGYPAATWVIGGQVESTVAEQYKALEAVPYIKVVERKYERGFLTAKETVTFEVFGDMFRAMERAQKDAAAADPEAGKAIAPAQPLRFSVRTDYQHGPLPGFSTFAAVVADSELVLDEETKKALKPMIGDQKPVSAHTVYRFDGGGVSQVNSPAFAISLPGTTPQTATRVNWEGFTANVEFTKGMASYTLKGDAPRLQMADGTGSGFAMSGLTFDADVKRMFGDEPLLYSLTERVSVEQMSVSPPKDSPNPTPVAFRQIAVELSTPVSGDFMDIIEKFGTAELQVGDKRYGPGSVQLSFRHLHARTMATLSREMMKLYADPAFLAVSDDPSRQTAIMAPLKQFGLELLKHNPEFRLDRASFKSAQGEAALSGMLKLNNPTPEELANPMMLLGKLEAGADLAVPEMLLGTLTASAREGAEEAAASDAETLAMQQQMLDQQLAGLAAQGLVTREAGVVKSKIAFRAGQLTVNGKPFDPRALAGGAPPGAPAMPAPDRPPVAGAR